MPSIEDAWNLPITAEMNSRQQQLQQQRVGATAGQGAMAARGAFPVGAVEGPSQAKRFKVEGGVPVPDGSAQPRPPLPNFYLTQQQLQMLHYLQQNLTGLTPQQQHLLQQLQNHYRLMQQHQQQMRLQQQQQQQQQMVRPGQQFNNARPAGPPFQAGGAQQQQQQQPFPSTRPQQPAQNQQQPNYPAMSCPPSISSPSGVNVSDQELQALLSQKDIATSLAEDLLKQFAQEGELVDLEQPNTQPTSTVAPVTSTGNSNTTQNPPSNIRIAMEPTPVLAFGGPMGRSGRAGGLKGPGFKKMMQDAAETEDDRIASDSGELREANIKMNAREVLDSCRGEFINLYFAILSSCAGYNYLSLFIWNVGAVGFQGLRHFNILSVATTPPHPPDPPQVRLTREQLLPPTPSVYLENKKDAYSFQLQEFCLQHPIAVVRGMASALKMGQFKTRVTRYNRLYFKPFFSFLQIWAYSPPRLWLKPIPTIQWR